MCVFIMKKQEEELKKEILENKVDSEQKQRIIVYVRKAIEKTEKAKDEEMLNFLEKVFGNYFDETEGLDMILKNKIKQLSGELK